MWSHIKPKIYIIYKFYDASAFFKINGMKLGKNINMWMFSLTFIFYNSIKYNSKWNIDQGKNSYFNAEGSQF